MVRVVAFFAAGILVGIYFENLISIATAAFLLVALVAFYLLFVFNPFGGRFNLTSGFIGLTALSVAGYTHLGLFKESDRKDHLLSYTKEAKHFVAEVTKWPEEKEKTWKYEVRIVKVSDGLAWSEVHSGAILYVAKEGDRPAFSYGDRLLVNRSLAVLEAPANPQEFDFKRFLGFKNIYHQQFLKSSQVVLLGQQPKTNLIHYAYRVRMWAADVLKKYLPDLRSQAIALALALGVTDGIDNELQSAYAASGAMHVLAVSGLHVGIIYGIVLLILHPLQSWAWSRWIIAVIGIVALWSYAFVTGLSPSVLRAATMFSFIALARPFSWGTNIYNTLAGSAFLLLLVNPYLIMSVGFQLSYLAVLGIVSIHRPLYLLFEPKHKIWDWIWNISCVSMAAQLATFSLGMLYFHQFPVYFLFANLFVIPGAILVLVTSLALLATSFFPPLASLLGTVLQGVIQVLNMGVFTIEQLPGSIINDIYLTTFQCWLLILALLFFLLLVYRRKFVYMKLAFFALLFFSGSQWVHYFSEVEKDRLVVYKVPGHSGIEWISKGASLFFADSGLARNSERIRFHIRPNRLFCGVDRSNTYITNSGSEAVRLVKDKDKTVAMVMRPIHAWPYALQPDYLIVGNNAFRSLKEIRDLVSFGMLILDSSNSYWICERIRKESGSGDAVYSVLHEGAFEKKF